jgi:hypothetical protein
MLAKRILYNSQVGILMLKAANLKNDICKFDLNFKAGIRIITYNMYYHYKLISLKKNGTKSVLPSH